MINQPFNQKNYGNGRYMPDFCSLNCGQKQNPHTGSNLTTWLEDRGIKKPV